MALLNNKIKTLATGVIFAIISVMRTIILYHPNSEFVGLAEDFKHEFQSRHPDYKVEFVSLETVEGSEMAKLYDVVRYTAILVVAEGGGLQKMWQDRPFPLIDEVFAYASR
jgi:hypothetical protein